MTPQAGIGILGFWEMIKSGGFAMWPLLICSLVAWAVIIERLWRYRSLGADLRLFHVEAVNTLLTRSPENLRSLCSRHPELPTARLMQVALERMHAKDERLRERWMDALERRRQMINQELRQYLWILGTIASSAPFIGLFGTVVGILRSFRDMAHNGSGGFSVVAGGISESLIATAAGIVVAVISVLAYNAFQIRWGQLVLTIKLQTEELAEMLNVTHGGQSHGT